MANLLDGPVAVWDGLAVRGYASGQVLLHLYVASEIGFWCLWRT